MSVKREVDFLDAVTLGTSPESRLGAGRTAVRANYAVYRTTPPGEAELFSVGRFEATVVDGDPARFASLRVVCDALVPGYIVLPL